jgi:hypothetical protein
MHKCPSKGMLLALEHVEPYDDYCAHCDTLYRRVLEPLGFEYEVDLSGCHEARCSLVVREPCEAGEAEAGARRPGSG